MNIIKSSNNNLDGMKLIKESKLNNFIKNYYYINNDGTKIIIIDRNQKIININIKPKLNNNSYLKIELNRKVFFIHELIANTFIPNDDKSLIIKHKDNNILNNHVNNLEWIKFNYDLNHTEYMYNVEFINIPKFLHNSELYKTCLESGDDFNILKKYYKNDLIIESIDDFIHLLYTLRFWCINKISFDIYDCIINNKNIIIKYINPLKEIFKDIFYDFLFIKEFEILLGFNYISENIIKICAENGFLNLMKYARENGYKWDLTICYKAALNGHLDCLKYAYENGCSWNANTCYYAAINGHLDCLKYAHENGCKWGSEVCSIAAKNGHLTTLKYAHENGCKWDEDTCFYASQNGHLAILKYAHENGCKWDRDKDTCSYTALHGHLDCLKYAHENGCDWDWITCSYAAREGHLDCLKYAHENGCPWIKPRCILLAKQNNHLECVKYIEEN